MKLTLGALCAILTGHGLAWALSPSSSQTGWQPAATSAQPERVYTYDIKVSLLGPPEELGFQVPYSNITAAGTPFNVAYADAIRAYQSTTLDSEANSNSNGRRKGIVLGSDDGRFEHIFILQIEGVGQPTCVLRGTLLDESPDAVRKTTFDIRPADDYLAPCEGAVNGLVLECRDPAPRCGRAE